MPKIFFLYYKDIKFQKLMKIHHELIHKLKSFDFFILMFQISTLQIKLILKSKNPPILYLVISAFTGTFYGIFGTTICSPKSTFVVALSPTTTQYTKKVISPSQTNEMCLFILSWFQNFDTVLMVPSNHQKQLIFLKLYQ